MMHVPYGGVAKSYSFWCESAADKMELLSALRAYRQKREEIATDRERRIKAVHAAESSSISLFETSRSSLDGDVATEHYAPSGNTMKEVP